MSFATELAPGTAVKFLNSPIPNCDELDTSSQNSSYTDEDGDSDEDDTDVSFRFEEEIEVGPGRRYYYYNSRVQPRKLQPLTPSVLDERAQEHARTEEYLALRSAELEQTYHQALAAAKAKSISRNQPIDDSDEGSDEDEVLGEEDQSVVYNLEEEDPEMDQRITGWVKQINLSSRRPRN
ncbi:hypothetical protein [Phaffia rhodozyma]|uniref:Uncharacterized protein n=1 Tax=Phaffia rhodozyma TaxID=264483 RepID=A0A0F7SNV7_PHARH|nr:hypothetical protein [Phaffia rhodozyma]